MKMPVCYGAAVLCLLSACQKELDPITAPESTITTPTTAPGFTEYLIPRGEHYADKSTYQPVDLTDLRFVVRFDSSAVYQSSRTENQWDINKLYGFSDNAADHHQFSARFGWNWSGGALRLHAYVYNNGERTIRELATVAIGQDTECRIRVAGQAYLFTVNGATVALPRQSKTERARGYRLYPYFGGDEPAPHDIRIWIRPL
jgi:hypothetical protein